MQASTLTELERKLDASTKGILSKNKQLQVTQNPIDCVKVSHKIEDAKQ